MKFKISNFKYRLFPLIILFAILILAAFLRLYRIEDYMTFLGDEGRDVLVVYNILHGDLTLLGPTASVGGFFLGPIYYYLMAPFLFLFNYNPVGPAVMVALFGIATVWLMYKVGSEFFDRKTGIIAALLYSISPLVISYSRSSWNPNLMPFFSLLEMYLLYHAVSKKSLKLFFICGVIFGIQMQLHYLATFLGVIIATYIILMWIYLYGKTSLINFVVLLKQYFLFFCGFIIGFSPFLAFEVRHGFPNIISIFNFIFHSGETGGSGQFVQIVDNVFLRLFGRLVTNFPNPQNLVIQQHLDLAIWYYATILLGICSFLFLVGRLGASFELQRQKRMQISLLIVWFVLGILLFGLYKKSIYDYYFGFLFPLPFLFVGDLFSTLLQKKWLGTIAGSVVLLILVAINLEGLPFRYTPNRQLAQVREIAAFVNEKSDGKPFNFALITPGNSDHAYRYFFRVWDHDPVIIQNPQLDPERTSVTNQLLIVCENPACEPLGYSLWEVAGFGRAEIAGEWNISVVKVFKLVHYSGNE